MEVPPDLITLYNHWDKHTQQPTIPSPEEVVLDQDLLTEVIEFAAKRMIAWENKTTNQPKPYSHDQILQAYRFCNIYRELDAQTIQIHQDLAPLKHDFDLWLLNLLFHRFVCRPQTVMSIGHLSFSKGENEEVMHKLLDLPRPKYGTAYVFPISTIQGGEYPTREMFFCLFLPEVVPQLAEIIRGFQLETVNSALTKLLPSFGYRLQFHWTEVLIDVAYQYPDKIDLFRDFHVGPGALRTLKALGKGTDTNSTLNRLASLHYTDFPYLTYNGKEVCLSAENWEGISCEFRKYTNLLHGTGRRRKY